VSGVAFYHVWGGDMGDKINKKIQYVVALDGHQTTTNITTNQMYEGATNEEKDTMNESQGEHGGRAIPLFWGDRIKWM
jgi:hypothetical protein